MSEMGTEEVEGLFDCGDAFEELGAAQPGDAALLERAIGNSMAAVPTATAVTASAGMSTASWFAILAAVIGLVVVIAWPFGDKGEDSPALESAPVVIEAEASAAAPDRRTELVPTAPRGGATDPPTPAVRDEPAGVAQPPVTPPARVKRTAAQLLEQANAARKEGRAARALTLYGQLSKAFPRSREAQTARVSAGRLYLERGKPKAALSQFRKYLSAAPRGSLAEEAAAGRATALGRLGQTAAERDAWTELLDKHPGSVHSARAKKRISELSSD